MTSTTLNIVSFIGALFTLAGVSGVSSADISGAVNVVIGVITLISIVLSHFTQKAEVAAAAAR